MGPLKFGFEFSGLVARFCGEVAVDNDGEELGDDSEGLPVVGPPARGLLDAGPPVNRPLPDNGPADNGLPENVPAEGVAVVGFVVTDPGVDGVEFDNGDDVGDGPASTCPVVGASIGGATDDRLTPESDGAAGAAGVDDAAKPPTSDAALALS